MFHNREKIDHTKEFSFFFFRFLTTSNPAWDHDYAGKPIGVNSIDPGVNNEG